MLDAAEEGSCLELPKAPILRGQLVELNPAAVYRELLAVEADIDPGFHEHFDREKEGDVEAIRWILLPQSRQPSGFVDLHVFNAGARTVEAGYWVMPSQRRKGNARAALTLVEEWLRECTEAAQIQLEIKSENTPSRRLAAALGYRHLGSCKPPLPRPQQELRELYSLALATPPP